MGWGDIWDDTNYFFIKALLSLYEAGAFFDIFQRFP